MSVNQHPHFKKKKFYSRVKTIPECFIMQINTGFIIDKFEKNSFFQA